MTASYQTELKQIWLLHHEPNVPEKDIGWRVGEK
jgi:hypothetical protein